MTLAPGTRLGFHEIVAPIGAGGMGEVYRARDTKLGRDVALKVLPAEMASSPERLERFQREARAVAALNHPAHRHDPLGRGIRRRPLPDHGARRGAVARPSHCRGPAAGREAGRDRHRARRRPGDGAREGHRSPGPEARQRHGGQRRAGQGARLRSRQSRISRGRGARQHGTADRDEDPGRRRDGDRAVHVAGAGPGPGSGPPDGHLLARHHPVRDGHRAAAVPRPLLGRARLVDPARHAAAARRAPGRLPRGAGARHPALSRKEPGGPFPVRGGGSLRAARRRKRRSVDPARHRLGLASPRRGRLGRGRAPTGASGSPCCRSSTAAPKPTSRPWPTGCPRRSRPAFRGFGTCRSSRAPRRPA